MTRPSHAALVEEVARHMLAARGLDYDASDLGKQTRPEVGAAISTARYILSLIFARLSDVTPEMVEAAQEALQKHINAIPISERRKTADPGGYVLVSIADKHAIRWRAMLAASCLGETKP